MNMEITTGRFAISGIFAITLTDVNIFGGSDKQIVAIGDNTGTNTMTSLPVSIIPSRLCCGGPPICNHTQVVFIHVSVKLGHCKYNM